MIPFSVLTPASSRHSCLISPLLPHIATPATPATPASLSTLYSINTASPARSECGKEFSYASNLRRHIMSSHNKNRFYCQICAKDFSYTSNLRRHMISSHGNEHRVGVFGENGEIEIKDESVPEVEDEDVKELHHSIFTPPPQQQQVAAICAAAAASHSTASPCESPAPCVTPNHLETIQNQNQINLGASKPPQIIHNTIFTTQAGQQQLQQQQQQQQQLHGQPPQQHSMTANLPGISPMKHLSHNISIQTAPVQIVPLNVPVSGVPGLRAPMTTAGVGVFRTPNGNIVSMT